MPPINCWRCARVIPNDVRYCASCGQPQDQGTVHPAMRGAGLAGRWPVIDAHVARVAAEGYGDDIYDPAALRVVYIHTWGYRPRVVDLPDSRMAVSFEDHEPERPDDLEPSWDGYKRSLALLTIYRAGAKQRETHLLPTASPPSPDGKLFGMRAFLNAYAARTAVDLIRLSSVSASGITVTSGPEDALVALCAYDNPNGFVLGEDGVCRGVDNSPCFVAVWVGEDRIYP